MRNKAAATAILISIVGTGCLTGLPGVYEAEDAIFKPYGQDVLQHAKSCGDRLTRIRRWDSLLNWLTVANAATSIVLGSLVAGLEEPSRGLRIGTAVSGSAAALWPGVRLVAGNTEEWLRAHDAYLAAASAAIAGKDFADGSPQRKRAKQIIIEQVSACRSLKDAKSFEAPAQEVKKAQ